MKKLREILGEMKLDNLPVDYSDVIDLRGQKPRFKAGDKWSTADASGKPRYVTKKEADAINSGKANGGTPFPDSWNKETQVASKDKQIIINKTPKGELPDVPLRKPTEPQVKTADNKPFDMPKKPSINDPSSWPKGVDITKTSFANRVDAEPQVKPGHANPEWLKQHPAFKKK
jgi:hypothetical protein